MKIALDATPLSASPGGVARYTSALVAALAEQYPEDRYWLLSDQPYPCPDPLAANLEACRSKARRWWSWELPRTLRNLDAGVFHGTDFSVPYLPVCPSVLTVHDLSPWLYPKWQPAAGRIRRRTPLLLRSGLATMVITPSEAIRRAAIERFSLDPDRVVAIPLAAAEVFRPVPQSPRATPYFFYAGTLEPRKNISAILNAWREVKKTRAVDLILAGRTRADFAAPPPEPGLCLLGPVSDQNLAALYSGASAFVYPSFYEGFGLPVLEAMQCGALVITSRDPAILEVTDGKAAIHVDASCTRSLAQAMAAAFGNNFALRETGIARARCFSWAQSARRTREVYDEACRIFSHS